ncbi:MAG TPA: GNAT family N-acetyltransferase [Pyrinomonadaceae bacterium]|jgi:CelD/BcsL family acetyltransferase involved in cellulose biosynthesis|nr:GNAT family N-acetyltransferase [Pyrinomonadaceae bacterium]
MREDDKAQAERMAGGAVNYTVLRELSEVEAVSSQWDALLEYSTCNRAFSSSGWFMAACRGTASKLSPYVIVARRGATLAGLLPLVLTEERDAAFPGELSDYNDMIVREGDTAIMTGLFHQALSSAKDYARLNLKCIRPDANWMVALRLNGTSRADAQPLVSRRIVCPYIRLDESYDEYLATKSANFRHALKRARGKALEDDVTVRQLTPDSFPQTELAEIFLTLNRARFQQKSCFKAENESFVREVLPRLFLESRLFVFVMCEREEIVGINLCMRGARSLCYWNGGFLSHAARWSPGKLLLEAGIREAHAASLEEYDLMRGTEAYKACWATHTRTISHMELTATSQ